METIVGAYLRAPRRREVQLRRVPDGRPLSTGAGTLTFVICPDGVD
jgi:hypothetical protein